MSASDSIKANFVKENSLLITKVILLCHFWKITLSIKLKKFYLLLSFSETSFSNEGRSIMGLKKYLIYYLCNILFTYVCRIIFFNLLFYYFCFCEGPFLDSVQAQVGARTPSLLVVVLRD